MYKHLSLSTVGVTYL